MKTFQTELSKQRCNKMLDDPYRIFDSIKAGPYRLSIQGSEIHYSTPKQTIKADKYLSMEMAIFTKDHRWLKVRSSKILKKFSRYDELMSHYDSSGIFSWVPANLIEHLYIFLKNYEKRYKS